MDRRQWIERLTETCLEECLGAVGPPDLAERILARAALSKRPLGLKLVPLAAAAALLLAALAWMWWPRAPQRPPDAKPAYAAPVATGTYRVEGGGQVRRGAVVHTDEGTAELILGGYASVTMKERSSVQVAGRENAEEIVLACGEVECRIGAGEGKLFTVQTELGTVSVIGTHFTVRLEGEEEAMNGKKMLVRVLVGTVLVTGLSGAQSVVNAGEWWGGRDRARPEARRRVPAVREAKTPLEKESAALELLERTVRAKQQEIETKVLQEPDVAAAMKAVTAAFRAYDTELNTNPEYADAKQEMEHVEAELGKLFRDRQAWRNREGREERMKRFRELRERSGTLRGKMAKLSDEIRELADLKKKKDAAVATFLTKYQQKVDANKEYAELGKQLKEIAAWSRDLADRRDAERANRRRERAEARKKAAEEEKKAEPDDPGDDF